MHVHFSLFLLMGMLTFPPSVKADTMDQEVPKEQVPSTPETSPADSSDSPLIVLVKEFLDMIYPSPKDLPKNDHPRKSSGNL
ncbi:hypothetical protein [Pontibacter sp. G13]|uniref:hypothetical protein n=1 Tax=Pontibacter sp. G13 TaxID=3074898 RepID=UPI00288B8F1E|nr:hypothetical protein [Pontibacter sp. G13]WNJ18093.1 hypothetical protein RJD25_24825 [Pontibacter sp. G13]